MLPILWLLACDPGPGPADAAGPRDARDCPDPVPMYQDDDGDGFGIYASAPWDAWDDLVCPGTPGWVERAGDCDDDDPAVHLGAPDACGDDVDADCVLGCAPVTLVGAGDAAITGEAENVAIGLDVDAGDVDGDGDVELVIVGQNDVRLYGAGGELEARWAVGATNARIVGDLDGDGWAEIAAGAPGLRYCSDGACDSRDYGGAWLIDGPAWAPGQRPEISGGGYEDDLGASVASGDVDGDGRPDVLLTEPGEGTVWIGSSGRIVGDTGGFAFALGAADVDGDGADDALVGSSAGVHVFTGPLAAEVHEGDGLLLAGDRPLWGGELAAGDVDGDGYADVVAPPEGITYDLLLVRVFPGPVTAPAVPDGATATLLLGLEAHNLRASVGDVDGDGVGDLVGSSLDGAVGGRGQVFAVFGPVEGARVPHDDADRRWVGEDPQTFLGLASSVADIDRDGVAEILATGWLADGEPAYAGGLFLLEAAP